MFLLTSAILNLQRIIEESHVKWIKQVYNCCWTSNSERITSCMPLNKCHEDTQRQMNKDVGADRQGFNKENTIRSTIAWTVQTFDMRSWRLKGKFFHLSAFHDSVLPSKLVQEETASRVVFKTGFLFFFFMLTIRTLAFIYYLPSESCLVYWCTIF